MGMKVSLSIPDQDVAFLDDYAERAGFGSRSAVVQRAVRLLRQESLGDAYEAAFSEWSGSEDDLLWESTIGDGLNDAAR
jgi:Arc/MetJ-type ribon-helix-helix transcriptional regulator